MNFKQEYKTASKTILTSFFSPGKLVPLQVNFQSWFYGWKYQLKRFNLDFPAVFKNWLISGCGRNYLHRERVRTANHHRKIKCSGYWEEDWYHGVPSAISTWEMWPPNRWPPDRVQAALPLSHSPAEPLSVPPRPNPSPNPWHRKAFHFFPRQR